MLFTNSKYYQRYFQNKMNFTTIVSMITVEIVSKDFNSTVIMLTRVYIFGIFGACHTQHSTLWKMGLTGFSGRARTSLCFVERPMKVSDFRARGKVDGPECWQSAKSERSIWKWTVRTESGRSCDEKWTVLGKNRRSFVFRKWTVHCHALDRTLWPSWTVHPQDHPLSLPLRFWIRLYNLKKKIIIKNI